MAKQIVFALALLITLLIFSYTVRRLYRFFKLTQPDFPVRNIGKRIMLTLGVAIGQTKIFRRPITGLMHALVFWGFCVIALGTIEIIIDGLGNYERSLSFLGIIYSIITASGDVFALVVGVFIIVFLFRRIFMNIKRFQGIEMKHVSHLDANIALALILFLMLSLLGMNAAYVELKKIQSAEILGFYPIGNLISGILSGISTTSLELLYNFCWWSHILLIFAFANILPYSKHFHVFMSVPNVFLSRLDPMGKLPNMDSITREVKMMLNPDTALANPISETTIPRFGVKDAEDITWKNYLDSLSCTECGRCTDVCPANLTGKKLSPRKIIMNIRARMKEKGPGLVKFGKDYTDNKSLLRDFISEEELWACTTCNACAQECPVNINHPTFIVDMRRYLVLEEASAPGMLKTMFNNIENNGAPWQYAAEDRLLWTRDLEMKVN